MRFSWLTGRAILYCLFVLEVVLHFGHVFVVIVIIIMSARFFVGCVVSCFGFYYSVEWQVWQVCYCRCQGRHIFGRILLNKVAQVVAGTRGMQYQTACLHQLRKHAVLCGLYQLEYQKVDLKIVKLVGQSFQKIQKLTQFPRIYIYQNLVFLIEFDLCSSGQDFYFQLPTQSKVTAVVKNDYRFIVTFGTNVALQLATFSPAID